VLETTELDVDETEETAVLEEDVDEEVIEEVVMLSVRVTVELTVDDDEAIEDSREDVGEMDKGMELDGGPETDDAEPEVCNPMTAPSVTSVSTTATAKIA
jgi:hypothetical protein